MRLYIVRHAEPAYPKDALTPHGHRQARALARRLSALEPQALYSSPMGRARETAQYVDLPCRIEAWTQELEGWTIDAQRREHEPWGEAPAWEVDPRAVRGQQPGAAWHAEPPWRGAGLDTAFDALVSHSDRFLQRLGLVREGEVYRLEKSEQGRVRSLVLVCHCGFALTWLAHLLALSPPVLWASFTLAPASLTTVVFEPLASAAEGGPWVVPRCLGLGDTAHLAE